jgi:CubicO group peptidase (beta-lactamase class C family)
MRLLSLSVFVFSFCLCFSQPNDLNVLANRLDDILKAKEIDGMQMSIVKADSVLILINFGKRRGDDTLITEQSLFPVGSLTQSLTALGLMLLVEEGKISLDDHLKTVAPELNFKNPWARTHPLKIIHLLEHTTGWTKEYLHEFGLTIDIESPLNFLEKVKSNKICRYPPGQYFANSNIDYTTAGYVIEKISGMSFEDFMYSRVLEPLEMSSSTYNTFDRTLKNDLAAHISSYPKYYTLTTDPAGGLISNAADMAKYIRLHLNNGEKDSLRIISQQKLKPLYTSVSSNISKNHTDIGYAKGFFQSKRKGIYYLFNEGTTPSFSSFLAILPDKKIGFFFALNSVDKSAIREISNLILDALLNTLSENEDSNTSVTINDQYIGYYNKINANYPFFDFFTSIFDISALKKDINGDVYFEDGLLGRECPLYKTKIGLPYFYDAYGLPRYLVLHRDIENNEAVQISNYSGKYQKVSALKLWSQIVLFLVCGFLIITFPIISVIRSIYYSTKNKSYRRFVSFRSAVFSVLCLAGAVVLFMVFIPEETMTLDEFWDSVFKLFRLTTVSLLIFSLSILFGFAALITFIFSLVERKTVNSKLLKLYMVVLGLAFFITGAYLTYNGLIGLTTWR